jgi:hypothetical protein
VKHSSFDAKKAITFDLPTGQVRLASGVSGEVDSGADIGRSVIVPAEALATIAAVAGETATRELGRALGRSLGLRVRARVGHADADSDQRVRDASIEDVVHELSTELAISGFGTLGLERWGRALVLVVMGAPPSDVLLAAIVEGMLATATGRDVRTTALARDGENLRVLVGNVASIERVIGWLSEGTSWGDAITRLHAPRAEAAA